MLYLSKIYTYLYLFSVGRLKIYLTAVYVVTKIIPYDGSIGTTSEQFLPSSQVASNNFKMLVCGVVNLE